MRPLKIFAGKSMLGNYYVIDSHCHIYPGKIAEKAVDAVGNYYGIPPTYDGVGESLAGDTTSKIDQYVVCSVATSARQIIGINEFIEMTVKRARGRFIGLGTYYPLEDDVQMVVDDALARGLHGFKIHPDMQERNADDPNFMRLYGACGKAGIPVMIHTGDDRHDGANPERMLDIYKSFPNTIFIGAHFSGYQQWDKVLSMIAPAELPNVYVDISSTFNYIDDAYVLELIRAFGVDKCMFGTDYPLWDRDEELRRLFGLKLSSREYRQILSENAIKVFNITKLGEYSAKKKKHRGKLKSN